MVRERENNCLIYIASIERESRSNFSWLKRERIEDSFSLVKEGESFRFLDQEFKACFNG